MMIYMLCTDDHDENIIIHAVDISVHPYAELMHEYHAPAAAGEEEDDDIDSLAVVGTITIEGSALVRSSDLDEHNRGGARPFPAKETANQAAVRPTSLPIEARDHGISSSSRSISISRSIINEHPTSSTSPAINYDHNGPSYSWLPSIFVAPTDDNPHNNSGLERNGNLYTWLQFVVANTASALFGYTHLNRDNLHEDDQSTLGETISQGT